jgi:hypothetical protein
MHEGCSASFSDGKQVADKVRMMGFSQQLMPMPLDINCECGEIFKMETFESKCTKCEMVYAVTPCHASDAANVAPAGLNY